MVTDDSLRTTKNATAAMFTVLVQVLDQRMPGVEAAFLERLGQAFAETKNDSADLNGVELMRWTQSLLTGFDLVQGQGRPFLEGR